MQSSPRHPKKSFWSVAARDFVRVGGLFPSSRFAVRSIAQQLPSGTKAVIEYGAGDGRLTKALLKTLPQDAKIFCFELNPDFLSTLNALAQQDQRVRVINGNVVAWSAKLRELCPQGADAIFSGIPFSFLKADDTLQIVKNSRAALRPGGHFVIYQYSNKMMKPLRRFFSTTHWYFEPRNFFPYFVMTGVA